LSAEGLPDNSDKEYLLLLQEEYCTPRTAGDKTAK